MCVYIYVYIFVVAGCVAVRVRSSSSYFFSQVQRVCIYICIYICCCRVCCSEGQKLVEILVLTGTTCVYILLQGVLQCQKGVLQ